MGSSLAIITHLKHHWHHFSRSWWGQLSLLLDLMVIASVAEILSIGVILPFLAVLTALESIFQLPAAQTLIQATGITNSRPLQVPHTITFGVAASPSLAIFFHLLWASTCPSFATGGELSSSIYRRTLLSLRRSRHPQQQLSHQRHLIKKNV